MNRFFIHNCNISRMWQHNTRLDNSCCNSILNIDNLFFRYCYYVSLIEDSQAAFLSLLMVGIVVYVPLGINIYFYISMTLKNGFDVPDFHNVCRGSIEEGALEPLILLTLACRNNRQKSQ